jgi:hypothetical protein
MDDAQRKEITTGFETIFVALEDCKHRSIALSDKLVHCFENVVLDFHTDSIRTTSLCECMKVYFQLNSGVECAEDRIRVDVHKLVNRQVRALFVNLVFPLESYSVDEITSMLQIHFHDEFHTMVPTVMLAMVKVNKMVVRSSTRRKRRGLRRHGWSPLKYDSIENMLYT